VDSAGYTNDGEDSFPCGEVPFTAEVLVRQAYSRSGKARLGWPVALCPSFICLLSAVPLYSLVAGWPRSFPGVSPRGKSHQTNL